MSITVEEQVDSREYSGALLERQIRRLYVIRGTSDDAAAYTALLTEAGETYQDLDRYDVGLRPEYTEDNNLVPGVWRGTVTYITPEMLEFNIENQVPEEPPEPGEGPGEAPPLYCRKGFDFSTVVANRRWTLQRINRSTTPDAPDTDGAVGVDGQRILGADIQIPVMVENFRVIIPNSDFESVKAGLASQVGKVNDAEFLDYSAGEVLFMGMSGGQEYIRLPINPAGDLDWQLMMAVDFRYAISPGYQIPDFPVVVNMESGTAVQGWDYFWASWKDANADSNQDFVLPTLTGAYVDRVYDRASLTEPCTLAFTPPVAPP